MKIGFIGAGKVGAALGLYFTELGLELSGYCDRLNHEAEQVASKTNCKSYPMENILDLIQDSDLIMLTVQDSYIQELAVMLSQLNLPHHKTYCHTSGALESEVMKALRNRGGKLYSFHPLQAFADVEQAIRALRETWFFVEGDLDQLEASSSRSACNEPMAVLLKALPNPVRYMTTGKKEAYHASAVVASNYLMVLLKFSQALMVEAGVEASDAMALLPLINSALENFKKLGPEAALSGPIVRGDVGTVARHLEVLEKMDRGKTQTADHPSSLVSWDSVYRLLGKATLDLALAKQLNNQEQAQAILSLLDHKMEAHHEK